MHCIAQSILEIALHRSRWQGCTEIVGRLLQLRIGQIELHSVGKYRLGVPENSRSEDWFVEHRIATWGLRQDNGSNQWSSPAPIALRGDQMGTNLDPCWWNFCHLHSPALCNTVSHGWTDESECFPIESDVHGSSG